MGRIEAMAALTDQTPIPQPSPGVTEAPGKPAPLESSTVPEAQENLTPNAETEKFQAIAKREAKFQADVEAWKVEQAKERAAYDLRNAELAKKLTPFQEFEKLKNTDAMAAMKSLGFSDEELINFLATGGKGEPKELTPEEKAVHAARSETDKLRKELADKDAKIQSETNDRLIRDYKGQIKAARLSNKEKYEYANFNEELADELAFITAERVLVDSQGKEMISAEEAIEMVEQFYEEEDKAMSALNKRKPKPEAEATPKGTEPAPQNQSKLVPSSSPKGIPARANAGTPNPAHKSETREEKRERLILALRDGTVLGK